MGRNQLMVPLSVFTSVRLREIWTPSPMISRRTKKKKKKEAACAGLRGERLMSLLLQSHLLLYFYGYTLNSGTKATNTELKITQSHSTPPKKTSPVLHKYTHQKYALDKKKTQNISLHSVSTLTAGPSVPSLYYY